MVEYRGRYAFKGVKANEARVGTDPERPVVSGEYRTITVGKDVATVQEAADEAAVAEVQGIKIRIPDGDYSDEDVVISGSTGGSMRGTGRTVAIVVEGNRDTPSNVLLNSLTVADVNCWVNLAGFRLVGNNPYDDENTHLAAYTSRHVSLHDIEIRGGQNGVMSYASLVEVAGVDFGTASIGGAAIQVKHGGVAFENGVESGIVPTSGEAGNYAYHTQFGEIYIHSNTSTLTPGNGYLVGGDKGVYDRDTGVHIGARPNASGTTRNGLAFGTTQETGNNVTVNAGATQTVFDTTASGNVGILGGLITGYDPSNVTLTWEDGSTSALAEGGVSKDNAGNVQSTVMVPPLGPVQKLTFDNGDGAAARDYGWQVFRTQV